MAILAFPDQRCARCKNAATPCSIQYQGPESVFDQVARRSTRQPSDPVTSWLEALDPIGKARAVMQRRSPEGRHIMIEIGHEDPVDQVLHDGCERHYATAGERLDEQWVPMRGTQPFPDVWYQPSFATRIT